MSDQQEKYFKNRRQAGERLGKFLEPRYKAMKPIVLGIPIGGIEVGYYVSIALKAEFSAVISKKLPYPGNNSLAFGGASEQGEYYITAMGINTLSTEEINRIVDEQFEEINMRIKQYRKNEPLPDLEGRVVIIVDDCIASGSTIVPVINLCNKLGADQVILATPAAGHTLDSNISRADAVEVLIQNPFFHSIEQAYENHRIDHQRIMLMLNPVYQALPRF